MFIYDTEENFIQVVRLVFNPIVYIWQYNMFKLMTKTKKDKKNNGQESITKIVEERKPYHKFF